MPFTLAHPAAALLLRTTPLPLAAVVAGTMAPDLPVFLREFGEPYRFTHSLTGVLTLDLAVSLIGVACWLAVLRDPVVDLMPAPVRERLVPHSRYTRQQWLLAVPAAIAGASTHVVWDLFTHRDRWGADHLAWLRVTFRGHERAVWAQYVSSVVGLAICLAWAVLAIRGRPRHPRPARVPALSTHALTVLVGISAAAGLVAGIEAPQPGLRGMLGQTAVVGTMILGAGLLVVTSLWHLLARRSTTP